MTISQNTAAGDFLWHYESLMKKAGLMSMIGVRKGVDEQHKLTLTDRKYDGKDSHEALELAKAWNSEGYNILFQCSSIKSLIDCNWLGLHIHAKSLVSHTISELEYISELNKEEFLGKSNILNSGDGFWFFFRSPNNLHDIAPEPFNLIRAVRNYCTELGIGWDISNNNDIEICVDTIDFFPLCGMPAAGMLNHDLNPPFLTNWFIYREDGGQVDLIDRILRSKDIIKIIKEYMRGFDGPVQMNSSSLDFAASFTPDNLASLIVKNDYFKRLIEGNHMLHKKRDIIESNLDLIFALRSHFLANPATLQYAITERTKNWPVPFSFRKIEFPHLLRAISASDVVLKMYHNDPLGYSTEYNKTKRLSADSTIIPVSYNVTPLEQALVQLSKAYGSQIHIARSGFYIITIEGLPREAVNVRDSSFHYRCYIPFPCYFRMVADQAILGKGALLLPHSIAKAVSDEVNRLDVLQKTILIYFWQYGKRFIISNVPLGWENKTNLTIGDIITWITLNNPHVYKVWKLHSLEKGRWM